MSYATCTIGLGGMHYAPYRATGAALHGNRLDEAGATLAAKAALQSAVTHGHND